MNEEVININQCKLSLGLIKQMLIGAIFQHQFYSNKIKVMSFKRSVGAKNW
jgi:hypothetical protein